MQGWEVEMLRNVDKLIWHKVYKTDKKISRNYKQEALS